MSERGIVYERLARPVRTLLDAAVGRDARGAYDHRAVLAKVLELRRGLDTVEDLVRTPRATLLTWGLTDEDLRELAVYLGRRGFEAPAGWAT